MKHNTFFTPLTCAAVQFLKAEIYTFSQVLCVYLFGYAAGVFVGGGLAKKTSRHLELFCIAAPVVGLCGIAYLPWMTYIFDMKILWNYQLMTWLLGIFGYLPHLYLSMLFFFMPSFFMGVCFPLLVQLERNLSNGTGDAVSLAYGVNTLGCVLGSVGTGFLLIPFLGSQTSMHILGLAATISGLNDSVPWYMALNVS